MTLFGTCLATVICKIIPDDLRNEQSLTVFRNKIIVLLLVHVGYGRSLFIYSQISRSYSKAKITTTNFNFFHRVGPLLICPVQNQFSEILYVLDLNSLSFKLKIAQGRIRDSFSDCSSLQIN